MKILLIEDDPADQEFVRELIERFPGVRYDLVVEEKLGKSLPDFADPEIAVILLDLNLPDSQGLETFTTVQQLAGHIPIIVLTGIDDGGLALKAMEGGAQDYLEKGRVDVHVLQKSIQYAIGRHRILQELKKTAARLEKEEEVLSERERTLQASETLYRTVFESTGAATAILDEKGIIVKANSEAETLFGYKPIELEGKVHWSKFVPQDELPRLAEYWRLLHEDPSKSSQHYEAKLVDRYGRIKYGILSFRLIPNTPNCVVSITDATERRRADEAISESEERFRGLFDHMSSGVAVYQAVDGGKDFIFQDFNRGAEKIEGVTKKELIGRRVTEAFPGVGKFGLLEVMQRVWKTGAPEYLPASLYQDGRNPGSWRENWVYKLPTGELVAVYNDVTERKKAEEALRESEERQRLLLKYSGLAIAYWDYDGTLLFLNRKAAENMGGTVADFTGKRIGELFPPDHARLYLERIASMREESEKREYEDLVPLADGERWYLSTFTNVKNASGEPIGVQIISQDITERKQAEAALRESEEKFRTVIENVPDLILVHQDGIIRYVNNSAIYTINLPPSELLNKPIFDFIVPEYRDRVLAAMQRRAAGEWVEPYEIEILTKSGKRTVVISGSRIEYEGKPATLNVLTDVTERKRAEEALRLTQFSVDTAADAIMWLRPDSSFFYMNDATCRMLGYSREKLLTMSVQDINKARPKEMWQPHWENIKEKGSLTFEASLLAADGRSVPVEITSNYLAFKGKEFICSFIRDLTERKKAEAALRESEEKYRTMFENTGTATVVVEEDSSIRLANAEFVKLSGFSREEIEGKKHWTEFVVREDLERMQAQHRLRRKNREAALKTYEFRFVRRNGDIRNIHLTIDMIPGTTKSIASLLDFTGRTKIEAALRESQAKLAEAMDMANLGHWEFDVPSGIFTFNDRFYALYGTTAEREGGYRMPAEVYAREFCHPDDSYMVADEVRKAIETTDPNYTSQVEHRIIRRDGEIRHIVVRIAITKDEGGKTVKTHGVNQDITERKRMEKAIRENEAQLNAVVQGSPVPQFVIDRNHRIIYWNRALEELSGIEAAEVLGTTEQWRAFYPGERPVLADLLADQSIQKIPDWYGEKCRPSKLIDGAYEAMDFFPTLGREGGWLYFMAAPIRDALGSVIGAVETLEDITERKQAEEALRESEERYRGVIESQTEFITRFTPDARVTFANDAYLRYFGLNRAEVIGKRFRSRILEEDRKKVGAHFASISRANPVGTVEHRIIMPDGQVRWQKWVDRAIFNEEGNITEYQSVGRDITEQKEAEEALKSSEAYLKTVFESVQTGLLLIDPETHVIHDANTAAVRMFGAEKEHIIGSVCHKFICPAEKGACPITDKGQKVDNSERIFLAADGTRIPILKTVVPVTVSGREFLLENFVDISERKRAELALRESEEKYRNLVELAGAGIAIIQDGSIMYANRSLGQMWGGMVEDMIRIPLSDLIHPDERAKVLERYEKRLAGEEVPSVHETTFLRKDGSSYPAEIHAGLITYQGRPADLVLVQEITDRKRAEKALQQSQERYKQIVEGTNAGVWVFDNDFSTIYANEQMARMLGALPDEMFGRSISDFVFPEDRTEVNEVFARIGEGVAPDTELRLRCRDHKACWLRVAAGPYYDVRGQRVGFTGIFSDVTRGRLAEEALRQAEAKFRNIVEFAVEGIYQIDTKGRFLTANTSLARILGYESGEEVLRSVTDTSRQLWVDPVKRREYLGQLKRDGYVYGFEAEYFRKDGSRIWVSLNTRAVKGPGGEILYSEGTVEDITQRKLAEQALRESEEMFRNPVEQSPVGVFLIQDGILRYANPKLAELTGYTREEIINRPFEATILPDDVPRVKGEVERLLRGEVSSAHIEYRGVGKDGTIGFVEAYGSPMLLHGRPAVYGTIIDITERKRMEDQIAGSLKEKEVLLREIHHRVKNNMQVISSLLSVQSQNIRDETVRGLFKESQNRIRSIALVHELLYRSENLDQIEYGAYLKKMFIPLFESYSVDQRKISMTIEAPKVMITIDKAVPCSLIVNELISNSLKHAFPGDRKGAINIRFGLDPGRGEYTLDYGDNGVGLPPGLDVKTLNTLGMRLINGLTKQLGGTLEVPPSEGTRYRITFPAGSGKDGSR